MNQNNNNNRKKNVWNEDLFGVYSSSTLSVSMIRIL